jgi:hypothetical protein
LHAEKHAFGIDRHHPIPGLRAHQVAGVRATDAGIIDQDIDFAVGRHRGSHRLLPIRLLGHVDLRKAGLAASGGNGLGNALPVLDRHIRHDDLGAFARKHFGLDFSHAACTTGHDCNFAC